MPLADGRFGAECVVRPSAAQAQRTTRSLPLPWACPHVLGGCWPASQTGAATQRSVEPGHLGRRAADSLYGGGQDALITPQLDQVPL